MEQDLKSGRTVQDGATVVNVLMRLLVADQAMAECQTQGQVSSTLDWR